MTDTHAHIYLPEFDLDREEIILRAKEAGVKKIFLPNIDMETIVPMLQLCLVENNYCFPMMGLHPCSVKENFEFQLPFMEKYLLDDKYKFYGIGECGLDYFWDKSLITEQKTAFEYQIQLAKKFKLPIIIHSRDAVDDSIELIAKHKDENLQGIFHCFSGSIEQLEKIIELGFYAGIGGVATFKNGGLDKVLKQEHLPNLVLETDSPYLSPVPFRGKRNEPSYLKYVLKRLGEILLLPESDILAATESNVSRIFKV